MSATHRYSIMLELMSNIWQMNVRSATDLHSSQDLIRNLPICHPQQLMCRGPDLLLPIKKQNKQNHISWYFMEKSKNVVILFLLRGGAFFKGDQYNKRHSQPVWLVCWLIHLPGCFWRSVSASWTPPRSQFLSPAGCTANRLKKLLLAAPHLCLTRGRRKKPNDLWAQRQTCA